MKPRRPGRPPGTATRSERTVGVRPTLDALARADAAGETIGARIARALELLAEREDRQQQRERRSLSARRVRAER